MKYSCACFLLFASALNANDQSDLTKAVDLNVSSRESLRTLYLQMTSTTFLAEGKTEVVKGEYWRSGEMWRFEFTDPQAEGRKAVKVHNGKVIKSLVYSNFSGSYTQNGSISGPQVRPGVIDPWETAMMTIYCDREKILPLDIAIQSAAKLEGGSAEGDQVLLRLRLDNAVKEVILKPSANYMVASVSTWGLGKDKTARGELLAKHFMEVRPGVWFPDLIEYIIYRDDQPNLIRRTSFERIRINEPIPPAQFKLLFPANILVKNNLTNEIYRSDSEGNKIGPSPFPESPKVKPKTPEADLPRLTESKEEERSFAVWLVPIGVLLIATALVIRKYRQSDRSRPSV